MTTHADPRDAPTVTAEALAERFPTLAEIQAAARAALPPDVWDFLAGGAGQEVTLRANGDAFDRWQFRPRVMSGLGVPSTATSVLGLPLSMPVLTAPFGTDGFFHRQGHLAVARANAAAGTLSIVPEAGTHSLEDVAAAAPAAARIAQLHPMGEERNFLRMLERIQAAGYSAICVTVDCPTGGWRERNLRNGFVISPELITGNYPPDSGVSVEDIFGQLFDRDEPIWRWDRLARLMKATDLPWIAKGILTGEDAQQAINAGASAVLVSNHGGRQLDGSPAAIDQLPEVASAVAGRVEVLMDSGTRSGTDIVKALALGARAVVIGRLAAAGLAAAGEKGVGRVLDLLRREMISVLTLLGRGSVTDLTAEALQVKQALGMRERVAVVGAGAIGGVLSQAISRAGHEVMLCVRTPISSLSVDCVPVPALVADDPESARGPADWVVLATKGYQTPGAAPWMRRLAGPGTVVVVVQNGIDHMGHVEPLQLPGPVVPALAYIGARRVAPGQVVHVTGSRVVVPRGEAGSRFARLMAGGPVDVELSADFLTASWRKLLTNVAANAVTALTGRPLEVLSSPGIEPLVRGLLSEAVAAGAASGADLSAVDVAATLDFYAGFGPDEGTSMLEDRRAGRRTEHNEINGAVVRAADRHGVDVPFNRTVLALLAAISPTLPCRHRAPDGHFAALGFPGRGPVPG